MVDGRGPLPDSNKELMAWIGIGLAVALSFGFFTTLDAQVEFLVTDAGSYFSVSDSPKDSVIFTEQQISNMRWATVTSVTVDAFGDERLFCGSITENGKVESIRLADNIKVSQVDSVSGACRSRFASQEINFWVHSQPGSPRLSEEDRSLESSPSYTCIVYGEMAISPVSKRVSNINCWDIVYSGDEPRFMSVPVYVR